MYNYDAKMNYTNDFEFRMCIRRAFGMKLKQYDNDIDLVSNDESNYDDAVVTKVMDEIEMVTRESAAFVDLYWRAAAKMFSTDTSIGLSVLFSYDYAALFHACLCAYRADPDAFSVDHPAYRTILQKM